MSGAAPLDALRALHDADHWIERVLAQREHLPELAELAVLEGELRELLAELQRAEAQVAPVRRAYLTAQETAQKHAGRARVLEAALGSSTGSARELAAMQHELEQVREHVLAAEDEELDSLMALEPLESVVATVKARAQPGVARRAQLRESVAQVRSTLDEEISALRQSRGDLAASVDSPWRERYEAALSRAGTSGAAIVEGGRCEGCRIALSPLDVDRFRRLEPGDVMDCPVCGRLLLP